MIRNSGLFCVKFRLLSETESYSREVADKTGDSCLTLLTWTRGFLF